MTALAQLQSKLTQIYDLGGPVVAVLLFISAVTLSVVLYKLWQYQAAGVGRHKALSHAIAAWDRGDRVGAKAHLDRSKSYLAPVVGMVFAARDTATVPLSDRVDAEATECFAKLERGLGLLDVVAQLAPLLGLFGTVLGMIKAFQTMQDAGASVDPSLLAGGIWVALLTTAAGLAVAMPTSLILAWFEGRMERERVFANRVLRTAFAPEGQAEHQRVQALHGT
ncbi:MotA/TolQ/ExbB proton channel family protein [Actibacterium lipolyticum]|uniref:Biopolymer transport protein ExbB n=1 Tax=Actibacterium lipolyticum TaxID=1524263 RepID=A0A238KII1_9RHOB|nr:MotA/TolQ/ExbB proton channel family protein [Actibacterium lipolyticum]SMX42478.1 biopolymer transport protein ExbB [Actibacterium lipolyticum]